MSYKNFLRKKYHGAFQFNAAKEGYPCNLQNVKGKRIYDLKLYGNSVQDGTPSRDSPVEILSVGDLVTDTSSEYCGKYDIPVTSIYATVHIYLNEPLRKVGDYADYIDYKNQKAVRYIEVLDDTGTKTIDESFGVLETPTEEDINFPELTLPDLDTAIILTESLIPASNIKALTYRAHDSAEKPPTAKEYGVRWKGTSSTVCERLGDAVGLVANAQLGAVSTVQNDFDNIYPWSEMRLCNLDVEGNILAYADEPSFTRDGTNGDVMVQIPKFYYKREKTAEGYEEWWICAVKLPGYELHPLFMDDGKEVSAVFHSAYNASSELLEDGTTTVLRSISGVQPRTRTTRSDFRSYARNKGVGWSIEDIACVNALQMLYMVEYANTNSQEKLGNGVANLQYASTHLAVEAGENTNEFVISTAYANKYKVGQRIEIGMKLGINDITSTPRTITAITAREDDADISAITFDGAPVASIAVGNMIWNTAPLNGSCDELGGGSGYIGIKALSDVAYRGIEGFHGKLFRFIDGVNIKDHVVHYANSIADYADGVYDGKYSAIGYTNAQANGYVSEFGYDEKAPWVIFPTETKGSGSTYVPDYYSQSTGEHPLLLGGYLYALGGGIGVFCVGCTYKLRDSHLLYGAHLIIKKP